MPKLCSLLSFYASALQRRHRTLGTQENISPPFCVWVEQPVWFCYWNVARVEVGHVQACLQKSQVTFHAVFSQFVRLDTKDFRWWHHLWRAAQGMQAWYISMWFRIARPRKWKYGAHPSEFEFQMNNKFFSTSVFHAISGTYPKKIFVANLELKWNCILSGTISWFIR